MTTAANLPPSEKNFLGEKTILSNLFFMGGHSAADENAADFCRTYGNGAGVSSPARPSSGPAGHLPPEGEGFRFVKTVLVLFGTVQQFFRCSGSVPPQQLRGIS